MKTPSHTSLPAGPSEPVRLFSTSFDGTTQLGPARDGYFHGAREQYEDFSGEDPTVPQPNVWEAIADHPNLGTFRVYHEGGTPDMRSAKLLSHETDPTRRFLRFSIAKPNVVIHWPTGPESKSRVQTELYGNTELRELYQSVRIRLGQGFAAIQQMPRSLHWLTIIECWNQPFWGDLPYPFRISVAIGKPSAERNTPLFFHAEGQKLLGTQKFENIWEAKDHTFPVPIGEWMTMESYYREGDAKTGRYYVAITPEDGKRRVLIDVKGYTHHPDNPAPSGMTHYNPLKLYTSGETVEYVGSKGETLDIDFDDFELWTGRTPEDAVVPQVLAGAKG